jgi:hypothetical protein
MSVQIIDKVAVSKQVGFKGAQRKLPPIAQVRKCLEEAKSGSYAAAVKFLTWYRFSKSPTTPSEIIVCNLLSDGYGEIFK